MSLRDEALRAIADSIVANMLDGSASAWKYGHGEVLRGVKKEER